MWRDGTHPRPRGTACLGADAGAARVAGIQELRTVRIAVTPTWAGLIDFEERMPSALV